MLPNGKIEELANFVFDYRDGTKEDCWLVIWGACQCDIATHGTPVAS